MAADNPPWTPLYAAAFFGHTDVLRVLLKVHMLLLN